MIIHIKQCTVHVGTMSAVMGKLWYSDMISSVFLLHDDYTAVLIIALTVLYVHYNGLIQNSPENTRAHKTQREWSSFVHLRVSFIFFSWSVKVVHLLTDERVNGMVYRVTLRVTVHLLVKMFQYTSGVWLHRSPEWTCIQAFYPSFLWQSVMSGCFGHFSRRQNDQKKK